jgi:hypothetical protein
MQKTLNANALHQILKYNVSVAVVLLQKTSAVLTTAIQEKQIEQEMVEILTEKWHGVKKCPGKQPQICSWEKEDQRYIALRIKSNLAKVKY